MKHQATLLLEALKTMHMSEQDKKWVDPSHSPVMFDVWHMVYLYFNAVGKGDLDPMLNFIIDGEYDQDFVDHVQPDFKRPDMEDMYLF